MKLTANKITFFRIILVPPIIVFMFLKDVFTAAPIIALVIFLAAAATDAFDGKYARKTNTVSGFGKFLDPICDKIFAYGIMIAFIFIGTFYNEHMVVTYINMFSIITMLTREFAIAAIRQIAAIKNVVIGADLFGKIKTDLTFISFGFFIVALFDNGNATVATVINVFYWIGTAIFYAATVFSVLSGINYYIKNKESLKFD
ncbi:MAG: CDP-diacylglycerol--glycerol-3-phosphate 3-phosphatidyltransferase [Clostridiales bacterium]|jgi:CDP-diacylglycerol--glycerol-3-phosphate 3-phosphatidyltransferase|nr:CDP-diacylglycerol--glycerol-3-phosphate 3-phosphatidyltransferase [Clostridiales bacterium]